VRSPSRHVPRPAEDELTTSSRDAPSELGLPGRYWEWTDGAPHGHGFTEDNLGDGDLDTTLHYSFRPVDDAPILRIGLDTTNRLGGATASIGSRQLAWLEQQLEAVHSRWYGPDGRPRRGRNEDHLVMVFARHNIATMANGAPSP
jgi:hypothetical protein